MIEIENITETESVIRNMENDPQQGLSTREAGKLLGFSHHMMQAMREKKYADRITPPFMKVGGKIIYLRGEILEWREAVGVRS